jgi:hypothetical protein
MTLLITNDDYVCGCSVLAASLREQARRASNGVDFHLICLVSASESMVSARAVAVLSLFFDRVIRVPHIDFACGTPYWKRFKDMYTHWLNSCFTKLHALNPAALAFDAEAVAASTPADTPLADHPFMDPARQALGCPYERVCLLDADMVAIRDVSPVFTTIASCPAGVVHTRDQNFRPHDALVTYEEVAAACVHGYGVSASLLLLEPGTGADFRAILDECREQEARTGSVLRTDANGRRLNAGPDEQAFALHKFANPWRHVHPEFNCVAWKRYELLTDIRSHPGVVPALGPANDPGTGARLLHYVTEKPWKPTKPWPDVKIWFDVLDQVELRIGDELALPAIGDAPPAGTLGPHLDEDGQFAMPIDLIDGAHRPTNWMTQQEADAIWEGQKERQRRFANNRAGGYGGNRSDPRPWVGAKRRQPEARSGPGYGDGGYRDRPAQPQRGSQHYDRGGMPPAHSPPPGSGFRRTPYDGDRDRDRRYTAPQPTLPPGYQRGQGYAPRGQVHAHSAPFGHGTRDGRPAPANHGYGYDGRPEAPRVAAAAPGLAPQQAPRQSPPNFQPAVARDADGAGW